MCGIFAIVSPRRRASTEALDRALDRLAHRGPDDRGTWASPRGDALLGHTRLSIIDLATGHQPLVNEDGSRAIVVNGEFYDHDRIREMLESRGHRLATRSDSEVALHLHEDHGVDSLRSLRGEFAFAIWNERDRSLFAARDRFGIKPLFYALHEGTLYVASEIKAILAAGVPARWDHDAVLQSLHVIMHRDRTLFASVRQVPPGHYLLFKGGALTIERYWAPDFPIALGMRETRSDAELVQEVEEGLEEAIRLRLRSDVPVACYLSGGVDSSSVLGFATRRLHARVAAFTVSFHEHPAFDEDSVAGEMARFAGSDYHPVRVTNRDFADVFMDSVESCEGIQFNGHAPARYILSREVRRAGYKVVLGGEGSDELFLGYHFAQRALQHSTARSPRGIGLLARLFRAPTEAQRFVAEVSPWMGWATRLIGFPDDLLDDLVAKFRRVRRLIDPAFLAAARGRDPYREFLAQFDWRGQLLGREPVRQVIFFWLGSVFPNYVLAAERLDMAHAVELRLPFLDHHLFDRMKRIPARRIFQANQNKHLLRRAVRPHATPRVYEGAKQPVFAPPSSLYKANPLTALLDDLLRSPRTGTLPFFDHREVVRFLDDVHAMPDDARGAFDPMLYMLASLSVLRARYGIA